MALCSIIALTLLNIFGVAEADDIEMRCWPEKHTISGHPDDKYNGEYKRTDDWAGGLPHYANDAGMHLFGEGDTQCDSGLSGSCWQLDHRNQSGKSEVQDLYEGGYMSSTDKAHLSPGTAVISGVPSLLMFESTPTPDTYEVSGHPIADYNGVYVKGEDWDGKPHYTKPGRHLFLFSTTACDSESAGGCWNLDNTDQSGAATIEDLYHGGYFSTAGTDLPDGGSIEAYLPFELMIDWEPELCSSVVPEGGMTCGEVKEAYRAQECCGQPGKAIDLRRLRRMSAQPDDAALLHAIKAAFQKAQAKGGAEARRLNSKIRRVLQEAA